MIRKYLPLIISAVILLPLLFTNSCANTTQAPTGGDKDTIPPLIIGINPLPGTVNVPVSGTKIVFTFNEYITIKDQKNVFLSPPQEKAPVVKLRGRDLVVSFTEDLMPNTTYTISFTDALADNNEGNMYPGYTYVFSTGATIDSLMMTGVVQDCNTLKPVKGATVLLYKDHSDSAVFLHRPYAAVKTDDWGFFAIPYIADTLYRIYAIKDENNNNIYDPDNEKVAFIDSLIRPVLVVTDTIPEILKYDMTDTVNCEARRKEHALKLFREKPSKQYLMNKVRVADRTAYITFMAPNAWIDSLWIRGYKDEQIITQFNIMQDSLEIWVNDRRPAPDTLHLFVNYRKTDTTGALTPALEHIRLAYESGSGKRTLENMSRRNIKHEDTTCVFTLKAEPETVEQNGFQLEFKYPIIYENFDSLKFRYVNPKQKEFTGKVTVEQDTMNLRRYVIRPVEKLQEGFEYFLKVPHRAFRDINGFYSDSTEVKVSLPKDEKMSIIHATVTGCDRKVIIDLLGEKRDKVLRSYIISQDCTLDFPYLKEGKYSIRITDDGNMNSIVDTGNLLEHRQPESVVFYTVEGNEYITLPPSSELEQTIDLREYFNPQP